MYYTICVLTEGVNVGNPRVYMYIEARASILQRIIYYTRVWHSITLKYYILSSAEFHEYLI